KGEVCPEKGKYGLLRGCIGEYTPKNLFCFSRNSWGLLCAIIQKIKTETSHIALPQDMVENRVFA
ncbi:MAG: hypothetical protein JW704_10265, partial [Anaerolineaceae bacterium]|nr:hypothetical protein [Anaerolineaceae bacterium]